LPRIFVYFPAFPRPSVSQQAPGGVPDAVECFFYRNRLSRGQLLEGSSKIFYLDAFRLTDDAGQALYREHPFGPRVDIAALPIELHPDVIPYFLNEYEFDEDVELYAGQDVFGNAAVSLQSRACTLTA
jgi:hypothetical protein